MGFTITAVRFAAMCDGLATAGPHRTYLTGALLRGTRPMQPRRFDRHLLEAGRRAQLGFPTAASTPCAILAPVQVFN